MSYPIAKITNLCYIVDAARDKVLLIHKKRGFGKGKWNAPGGKVESGEKLDEAVCREVMEETGLRIEKPKKRGDIQFIFANKPEWNQHCHVYYTEQFSGTVRETHEARPEWFAREAIPLEKMWEDDILWVPDFLQGKEVKFRFFFNEKAEMTGHEAL